MCFVALGRQRSDTAHKERWSHQGHEAKHRDVNDMVGVSVNDIQVYISTNDSRVPVRLDWTTEASNVPGESRNRQEHSWTIQIELDVVLQTQGTLADFKPKPPAQPTDLQTTRPTTGRPTKLLQFVFFAFCFCRLVPTAFGMHPRQCSAKRPPIPTKISNVFLLILPCPCS